MVYLHFEDGGEHKKVIANRGDKSLVRDNLSLYKDIVVFDQYDCLGEHD